jgi:hypothetical protein
MNRLMHRAALRARPAASFALRQLAGLLEIGALPSAAHRPWPLPDRPWIMAQTWETLLFAHWPLPERTLRPLVPPGLVLHTFAGQAWVTVAPFVITGLRPRVAPPIRGLSTFPELNVRTYVTVDDRPGVFFFSLDAGSAAAVTAARALFSLPYFRARFDIGGDHARVVYRSRRIHPGAPAAEFWAVYLPTGPARPPEPGTLAHWLTERYCLYAVTRSGRLRRAEIHHLPWPLQPAEADIRVNTLTSGLGFALPGTAPLVHYARRLDVHVWAPQTLPSGGRIRLRAARGSR